MKLEQPKLLVHDHKDMVGVVVVEDLVADNDVLAVITEDNSSIRIDVLQAVPIGHKIALRDIADGETIIKYGQDIGKAVAAIRKGEHVHTHNVKTKRW
ncbi:flagellar biosynthesis protein FlgA [Novosphingobium sp. AAP83]|nr:flagellar biosynthesis protein FlgA [Novosphingobium sp. AAP83]